MSDPCFSVTSNYIWDAIVIHSYSGLSIFCHILTCCIFFPLANLLEKLTLAELQMSNNIIEDIFHMENTTIFV